MSSENPSHPRRPPPFSRPPLFSSQLPRVNRELSLPSAPTATAPPTKPAAFSANTPLRPGEKRRNVRTTLANPNFNQPRGRLVFHHESLEGDSSNGRNSLGQTPVTGGGLGGPGVPRQTLGKKMETKSPDRMLAAYRTLESVSVIVKTGSGKSGDENLRNESAESAAKKRRLDSSGETSLNSSLSPGRTTDLIKFEKEIARLTYERDIFKDEVKLERLRTEEKIRKHKQEEESAMAKAGEIWSQAEKILQENDRLREKMDKAETDAIATRKQYEEQIAGIRMENMGRTQQLDKDLREARTDNLSLNERLKTASRERTVAVEENQLLKGKVDRLTQFVGEIRDVRKENQNLLAQLQAKDGQIADLTSANALLANLPEELKQYRELQIKVPLLEKENQKLRERAALARANEDKIQTLEDSIKRYETRQCRFYDLELENEQLKSQIHEWEAGDLAQSPSKKPRGIQQLLDRISEMEAEHKKLGDVVATKQQKIVELTDNCRDLEHRVADVKSQLELSDSAKHLLEHKLHDLATRLTTTVTERDTLKLIKDTIDLSTTTRRDPAAVSKLRDLEDRATRSQTLAADLEHRFHTVSAAESQLKVKLDDLQRRYEAETVHAHELLQSLTQENETLKRAREELQQQLDEAGVRVLRGEYDPARTDVLTVGESPWEVEMKRQLEEAGRVVEENKLLKEKLNQVKMGGGYSGDVTVNAEEFLKGPGEQLEELKGKLEKSEKQRSQDMSAFKKTSANFRQICRDLLGWNVRVDSNKVIFRVADAPPTETIVFEREEESRPWELRSTEYTLANQAFVEEFLRSHSSPPGFFARIILKILSERTLICLDSPTP